MPSTSTSTTTCDHANILEENARLKDELVKLKGKGPSVETLQVQRPRNGKEGLSYVAKKNNKKNKKAKPAQAKKTYTASGVVISGDTPRSDFVGTNNPHHILYVDYYGDVHAKYVGPSVDFIAYSIWVPKTPVANVRGPIERWGPKSKQ